MVNDVFNPHSLIYRGDFRQLPVQNIDIESSKIFPLDQSLVDIEES
jgi:hypothetical protein